jgi:hypothetical protein
MHVSVKVKAENIFPVLASSVGNIFVGFVDELMQELSEPDRPNWEGD